MLLVEEIGQRLAHRGTDPVGADLEDALHRLDHAGVERAFLLALGARVFEAIGPELGGLSGQQADIAQPLHQIARGDRADMADPQPEQQPRGVGFTARFHRFQQIIHRALLPPVEREDVLAALLEAEDVGGTFEPAEREELVDRLLAQTVDVERPATDEMLKPFRALRGTDKTACATHIDLALFRHRLAAAFGAMVGEVEGLALGLRREVIHKLWNNIARALDHHAVARTHAQPFDFVAIVQRDIGHRHTADEDRGEPPDRGQLARPPDLNVDALERGLGLLGGEFMRQRPARRLGDETEALLVVEPVDLVDHAVDFIRQVGPRGGDGLVMCEDRCGIVEPREQRRDGHAPALDHADHLFLRVARHIGGRTPAMRPELERALRGDLGVLLPQRSRGGIARVGKLADLGRVEFLALFLRRSARITHQPRVECLEIGASHIDLAADLEHLGRIARQLLRNVGDMRDIGGNVLAHLPVAARRRAHQPTLLVAQRAGQAVDLVFRRKRHRIAIGQRQEAPHARDPILDLLRIEGIVEAHHANLVRHLAQRRGGGGVAHLAAGRILAHQMRKRCLKFGIAPHQRVIFLVGNLGRVLGMIKPVVLRDLPRQPHQFVGGFCLGDVGRHSKPPPAAGPPAPAPRASLPRR